MTGKKRSKRGRPGWRRVRTLRRLGIAAAAVVAAGVVGWWLFLGNDGGGGQKQYLVEPAPAFALPTVSGEEVSLADHLGRHALLLYFNEGVG